jgi:hypothetical protein
VLQHLCVATVGAADEEDDVGSGVCKGCELVGAEGTRGHMDDLGARRQPNPIAGLSGHRALIPHDGKAQSAPGRGAGEDPAVVDGRRIAQLDGEGPHAVHDIGVQRRRGLASG